MTRSRRRQFGLGALLTFVTVIPLWFGWAESVCNEIEARQRCDAAAAAAPAPRPAVVFESWQGAR